MSRLLIQRLKVQVWPLVALVWGTCWTLIQHKPTFDIFVYTGHPHVNSVHTGHPHVNSVHTGQPHINSAHTGHPLIHLHTSIFIIIHMPIRPYSFVILKCSLVWNKITKITLKPCLQSSVSFQGWLKTSRTHFKYHYIKHIYSLLSNNIVCRKGTTISVQVGYLQRFSIT